MPLMLLICKDPHVGGRIASVLLVVGGENYFVSKSPSSSLEITNAPLSVLLILARPSRAITLMSVSVESWGISMRRDSLADV